MKNEYRNKLYEKHREPSWDKAHGCFTVARLVKAFNAKVIAEIGVCVGNTAVEILHENKLLYYLMVDHWKDISKYELILNNFSSTGVEIKRSDSMEALKYVDDESLDFVYIDTNHSYKQAKREIFGWIKKVRRGGVLAGDGYGYIRNGDNGVKRAVHEIFSADQINVNLGPDCVFWVMRPYDTRNSKFSRNA